METNNMRRVFNCYAMNKTLKKMYSLYRSTLLQSHQKHGWKCISRLWYDSIPCGAHRDELPRRPSGGGRVAPVAGWAAWVSFGDASGEKAVSSRWCPFSPGSYLMADLLEMTLAWPAQPVCRQLWRAILPPALSFTQSRLLYHFCQR